MPIRVAASVGVRRRGTVRCAAGGGGEIRPEGRGQPAVLMFVDGEEIGRADQFGQMTFGRGDDDQGPAGLEYPVEFGAVAGGEDVEDERYRAGPDGERLPGVPADSPDAGSGPGGPAQRRDRDVHGQAHGPGATAGPQRAEHRGQVVPGARAGVEHHVSRGLGGQASGGQVSQRLGQRPVVPGAEEGGPVRHHLGCVSGAGARAAGHQVHVALPSDVKGVPGGAAQHRPGQREGSPADRADQQPGDVREQVSRPRRPGPRRRSGAAWPLPRRRSAHCPLRSRRTRTAATGTAGPAARTGTPRRCAA